MSGNPGGRPKGVKELLELARSAVPAALALAMKVLGDDEEEARVRLEAAKFLTAYGIGQPPREPVVDPYDSLSDDELERQIRAALEQRKEGALQ